MMKSEIIISVIIPMYNSKKYVKECLNSLIGQEFKGVEIICVDDGSTDGTPDFVKKEFYSCPIIKIYEQKHMGTSYARNYGVQKAIGKYVIFLDSDDYLSKKTALSTIVDYMENGKLDILCYDGETVYETQNVGIDRTFYNNAYTSKMSYGRYERGLELLTKMVENDDYVISSCMKCYRKDFLISNNIEFPVGILYEDNLFTFKSMILAKNAEHIKEILYKRRIHNDNTSRQEKTWEDFESHYFIWLNMLLFVEKNIQDVYMEKVIQKIIEQVKDNAIKLYGTMSETEKSKIEDVNLSDRYIMENVLLRRDENNKSRHVFPYHLFKRGDRILLYGAGDVGLQFYYQAQHDQYVDVVGLVDINADKIGSPAQKPAEISKFVYDYVLICIERENVAKEVKKNLMENGIDFNCIKWDGKLYPRKSFMNNMYFQMLDRLQSVYNTEEEAGCTGSEATISLIRKKLEMLEKKQDFLISKINRLEGASNFYHGLLNQFATDFRFGLYEKKTDVSVDEILETVKGKKIATNMNVDDDHHGAIVNILFGKDVKTINKIDGEFDLACSFNVIGRGNNAHLFIKAVQYGKQILYVENGFIESVVPWNRLKERKKYRQEHSMVLDKQGIYFDARHPSDLEDILNSNVELSGAEKKRARKVIDKIVSTKLSKYNHQPVKEINIGNKNKKVLIIDQVLNDASILYGWANASTFKKMVDRAVEENPDADIIIKKHPVTMMSGFQNACKGLDGGNVYLIDYDINPICLIEYVDKVYVCTSQMGFEALMCGKEVHAFGMPFYAGWGLTIDDQICKRRIRKRTLEEVFYAAYIMYTKYVSIKNERICTIEEVIDEILALREEYFREKSVLN